MSEKMSRRDFVKTAGVAAGALALAGAGVTLEPTQALAENISLDAMEEGVAYTITVNPIVPMNVHNIIKFDAVITDTTTPSAFKKPTTRKSSNGTITKTVSNGKVNYEVFVNKFNHTFGVLTITSPSTSDSAVDLVPGYTDWTDGPSGYSERIDSITMTIPESSVVEGMGKYVFDATEYANYMNQGYKEFPITVEVSFDSISA